MTWLSQTSYSYSKTPNHKRKWQFHCHLRGPVLSFVVFLFYYNFISRDNNLYLSFYPPSLQAALHSGTYCHVAASWGSLLETCWGWYPSCWALQSDHRPCQASLCKHTNPDAQYYVVNWLVTSHRRSSQPYISTASTGRTDGWFLPVTPVGVRIMWDKMWPTITRLESYCLTATPAALPLRRNVWKIQTLFPSQLLENGITNICNIIFLFSFFL